MLQKTITWPDAIETNYYKVNQVVLSTDSNDLTFYVEFHVLESSQKVKSAVLRMAASGDLLEQVMAFVNASGQALVEAMDPNQLDN
jgi:hypothetical protein